MKEYSLCCQIREADQPDGGLMLELLVEEQEPPYARATVSGEQLELLRTWFGLQRSDVVGHLHLALMQSVRTQDDSTEITHVVQAPPYRMRFYGWFTYRAVREISTGFIWYDFLSGETWPESEIAPIRSKMIRRVADLLAEEDREASRAKRQQVSAP